MRPLLSRMPDLTGYKMKSAVPAGAAQINEVKQRGTSMKNFRNVTMVVITLVIFTAVGLASGLIGRARRAAGGHLLRRGVHAA